MLKTLKLSSLVLVTGLAACTNNIKQNFVKPYNLEKLDDLEYRYKHGKFNFSEENMKVVKYSFDEICKKGEFSIVDFEEIVVNANPKKYMYKNARLHAEWQSSLIWKHLEGVDFFDEMRNLLKTEELIRGNCSLEEALNLLDSALATELTRAVIRSWLGDTAGNKLDPINFLSNIPLLWYVLHVHINSFTMGLGTKAKQTITINDFDEFVVGLKIILKHFDFSEKEKRSIFLSLSKEEADKKIKSDIAKLLQQFHPERNNLLQDIYLGFLLHLNEDFDDDLLQDAMNLLDQND